MSGFVWSEKERKRAEIDFARLLERNVDRSGALDLLDWLEETDFYIAPAGGKASRRVPGRAAETQLERAIRITRGQQRGKNRG